MNKSSRDSFKPVSGPEIARDAKMTHLEYLSSLLNPVQLKLFNRVVNLGIPYLTDEELDEMIALCNRTLTKHPVVK